MDRIVMFENFEVIQQMSKHNVDVTMKSFAAVSRTAQAIATEMADYSKRSFENGTKAVEKLLSVKSLDKAIELQSEIVKSIYEDYRAQATKFGELYTDLAHEAFMPYEAYVAKPMPEAGVRVAETAGQRPTPSEPGEGKHAKSKSA
jgi:hypothetical protein